MHMIREWIHRRLGLATVVRDVKCSLRTVARSPGFAATAVLSLALGIGASAGIVALPAAFALRRLIEAELFGVRAFDGPTIVTATALLGLVALAAALLPAWRASRMNPNALLKAE
jgi:hypothetical protein